MDPQARKTALRMFSNGVYIMTARSGDQYGGATVTWISQASFYPPLVIAAVRKDSNVFRCIRERGPVAIHVLGAHQTEVAQRFFTPTTVQDGCMNAEPFRGGALDVPVLQSAPAHVECQVRHIYEEMGDHAVVVLEVMEAECPCPKITPLTVADSPWQYGG